MSFANELAETSAQFSPDIQKYVREVQEKCKDRARKGHNCADFYVFDFLGGLEDMGKELDMMGLTVRKLCLDRDKALEVKVEWTKKRKAEADTNPVKKKRVSSTAVSSNSGPFASDLATMCASFKPDIQKYIREVQEKCKDRARKGHTCADFYVFDFFGELEDMRNELDMMGLTVRKLRLDTDQALEVEVKWPSAPRERLFQPSGLTSGNFWGDCKVCFNSARMCRLHPCGHLMGACCANKLMNKPCPFCRESVRIAHALFKP